MVAPVRIVGVVFTVVTIVVGELSPIVVVIASPNWMFTTVTGAAHNFRLEIIGVPVSTPVWVLCILIATIAVVICEFVAIFIQIKVDALCKITLLRSIVAIIRFLLLRLRFLLFLRF